MSSLLEFAGTCVKTTAIAVGTIIVAAAGFTYATKPDDKVLKTDIENLITKDSDGVIENLADGLLGKIASKTAKTTIKDYVFVKTADVKFVDGTEQKFIGICQNWVPVG